MMPYGTGVGGVGGGYGVGGVGMNANNYLTSSLTPSLSYSAFPLPDPSLTPYPANTYASAYYPYQSTDLSMSAYSLASFSSSSSVSSFSSSSASSASSSSSSSSSSSTVAVAAQTKKTPQEPEPQVVGVDDHFVQLFYAITPASISALATVAVCLFFL